MKLHKYKWEDQKYCIETQQYVDNILQLKEFSTEDSYKQLRNPIWYKILNVKPISDNDDETMQDVLGVCLPNDANIASMKPNTISCPENCTGLIKLPNGMDFVIIEKSNFNGISILEMSLNEMKKISKRKTAPRAGAAGGFMLPSGKSRSLSPVTKNDRMLVMRKKSVAMSLVYKNEEKVVKGRNSIYQDLYMDRYSSQQKFKAALKSTALQRIMVVEMISRLRSFLLLDKNQLIPYQTSVLSFLKYDKQRIQMEEKFLQTGISKLDSKLLSWSCTTGEMRNHQAVKAHFDGNKNHPVETMTLFGRIPVNLKNMKVEMLKEFDHGYLLLPLEGVTIKIKCGFDIIHCSLKKTIHLADNSRNTCNWSRVHGP